MSGAADSAPDPAPGAAPDIGRRVNRAVAWVGAASAAIAVFDAITLGLLLAFWVTDVEFAIATYAVTLTYFLDLPTEAGLTSVLIQRARLDDDTVSSVFWLNALLSVALFGAMFVIGPAVGALQGHPIVGTMLILYATKLLYQNVYFVPAALLRRELRFKELSIVRTIANLGDVAARIGFAIAGEPIYCFVAAPLVRVLITGIGLQLYRPWRPRWVFRAREAPGWLAFGFKTTASQYLAHFYNNIGYQIVGYYFGERAVAAYRVAYELVLYPVNFVSNIVTQVAFPAFARLRADRAGLTAQFVRFSRQNLAVLLPVIVLIAVAASDLLAVLFPRVTEDGAAAARILCVVGLLRTVDCLYLPLLDGVGLAGRNVLIGVATAVVLLVADIVAAVTLGPEIGFIAVALARVIGYPLVIALHAYLALGQLDLPPGRYLRTLGAILGCGVIAALPGLGLQVLGDALAPGLRLALTAGATLAACAWALQALQGLGLRAVLRGIRG